MGSEGKGEGWLWGVREGGGLVVGSEGKGEGWLWGVRGRGRVGCGE